MFENNFESLKELIALKTIAGNELENEGGIKFLKNYFRDLNFATSVEGESPTHQPVLIARYTNPNSAKKIVLYSHYDVEKIKKSEKWQTDPFKLTEKEGRYFARGIADNKGILLMRLLAFREMLEEGVTLPNLLWLIQGEEEVQGKTPFKVFPKWINQFNAKIYLEETGVYQNDLPVIFHLPAAVDFLADLNQSLYHGKALLQNRTLTKFTKQCPFISNIPQGGIYLGFGPNDEKSRIHRDNESLSVQKLNEHKEVFKRFIKWVIKTEEGLRWG